MSALPPDPESVEKWRSLPQNKPSPAAYSPVFGGLHANRALLFGFGIVMLLALIVSWFIGR